MAIIILQTYKVDIEKKMNIMNITIQRLMCFS